MSFAARIHSRMSRRLVMVAGENIDGGFIGWDNGFSGMDVFGSISDSFYPSPMQLNGARIQGIFCAEGTTDFRFYFRNNGDMTFANITALANSPFFDRIVIKNALGAIVANMPKSTGAFTSEVTQGFFRWNPLAGASALVAGTTYTVEIG